MSPPGVGGEEHDPGQREPGPEDVGATARGREGDSERADELQRHRDPERDPVEREVEGRVHAREGEAEEDDLGSPGAAQRAQRRAPDRDQDDGAEDEPQRDGPGRPELVEEGRRERGADLDRDHAAEDERDRRCPAAGLQAAHTREAQSQCLSEDRRTLGTGSACRGHSERGLPCRFPPIRRSRPGTRTPARAEAGDHARGCCSSSSSATSSAAASTRSSARSAPRRAARSGRRSSSR